MADIRNQALAWKNYLRNKQEEDERKKQEAETVAKVSALSNGLTTNQNANILRAATLGATQATQNTSTFDQYRNALAQSRAKMQGLQNRVLAQNQAAARQVGIQKNPLMPQFNDKRAATFHEDVQRKAQNLWKEHKQNQRVNQYFDDNSVAGLTKKKQGYEDAAQKSKTNIQQYLKDAFAKDPDGERLMELYGLNDGDYTDDNLRELWERGMLSSPEFAAAHPTVDLDAIEKEVSSYFQNKASSADTDTDILWSKTYESPEGLVKSAKDRDDYDKLLSSYNGDQFWARRLSNYNNPDFNGDGRVADFIDEADRFENLGETAYDFRTVAGNRMATAREALADADQQAREKWIAKYGDSTADYINQKNIDYLIRAAREIGDSDLEGELSEIYAKAEAKSESLREGTDEVLAYLTKDEKDALKYWMQYGNETGDYTNANVLYEGLWAKSALRKRDSDTEDWKAYAERNGRGAWLNNRWQQFKSGVYAPFAGIAVQQHGEGAVFSKWFDPTARNQVQETVIQKNVSDYVNGTSIGKWFNESIGSALGCDAGDVANFLMEAADSTVDNVFRDLPAIAGVPGWHVFSLGVMSASSFNSTLYNDLMAGRDRESAMQHALAQGAIEYLTEKIGGEAATKWINDSGVLTYWLKTGGAEAVEELGGGIAGNFLERVNNDYHNDVWQGALQQVNANPSIGFMAALAQQQKAQSLEPVKAAASAFISMLPNAVANVGTYRQMRRNEAMDEAQGEMYLNSDDVSQIQQLEAERSGLTEEERELLAEQERRRSGSLEDRKAAMTEIMEQEAKGQQTEEPETAAPGPQVDVTERRAGMIEEGQQAELDQLKEQWSEANDEVNQLQDEIFEATQSGVQSEEVQAKRDQLRDAIQRRDDLMARAEEIRYNTQGSAGQEDAPKPRRTAAQVRESNIEETTNQTPPAQQAEKQTPPGPQQKPEERRQANVEDGKKPKQKKSELAAMRERIAGMSDDAITARLGEIAERRASLEAELARRKDVVSKRGKTIEKLVKTATGAKVKAATAEELLGETKQDSAVSTGDLGDGKTIKGLDKDGNIMASDGSTISAKDVDWDAMPVTKEVYDSAMEISEDYGVAPGVVYAAYANGMGASMFRSGARAIASAAFAGTDLQTVLNNNKAASAIDMRMAQAMYEQAAKNGSQFARERMETQAKLKALEGGTNNITFAAGAKEFLEKLKPDSTILQSVQVINDLFGKAGPKIEFFLAGEGAEQGSINKAADTIRIALDAGDKGGMVKSAILQVMPHELVHMIASRYVNGYLQLQKYVSDYLANQGKSLDDYVEDIRAEYKAAGVDLTAEQATEEAVAKASELVLKDSKFAERVANNNPSLANRIVDWLRSMKARIANIFKNYKPLSAIARDMQDAMDGYVKIWDEALAGALNIKREEAQNIETVKGDEGTAYTASNEEIGFHYELVNAFELTASNDYETMLENPLYPSELQPRDRSRQTSEDQIDSIVRDLNPNRLMGSSEVSTGAPIVGPDYIVESGNGRTIALQRVMKQGGKNAQKYTEALRQNAAQYGFNPEDIKNGQVLVRVRDSAMNNAQRAEFAKASNVSATMTSAAAETATSDAQKLSSKALDLYNPDGDVQSNADFFYRFLNEAIPASDRNSMLTRTGQPSQALIARAKAAMFYRAYGNNDLTAHMSEQADPEAKNAVNAMMNVAARVASIFDQIKDGTLHDINFADDIANAAAQFIELKRTGQNVKDWLDQSSMFEQDDTVRYIVGLMEKYKRSAVKLTGAFNSMLDQVEAAGNPEQESLFGDDTLPTKQEIVQRAGEEDGTRFSLKSTVEQVRDLVAVHNINEENLERSIIKGGFPGPSIAIVKSKLGHNRFGELSVVFRPKTIDPGADARNAVFGGDAWTPQYPKVSRAVREEDILKVNDILNSNLSNIKFPGLKSETRNYILKHAGEIHKQGAKEYFSNYFDRFIDGKLIALFLAEQDYGPEMIAEANKKATNDPLKLKGTLGYLTDAFNKKPAYMDEYVSWLDDIGSRLFANGSGKITSKSTGETYEETPENVVKVMFESGNRNATGPDEVAATAKRYGSLEQIQGERGRLPSTIDERLALHADEHAISDAIDDAAYDLERLLDVAKIYDHNHQEIRDMVIRAVGQRNDTGETIFGILNDRLNEKGYGYVLNEAPYQRKLEELANILEDVNARSQGNMTAYFEAKPERVVGLDEIEAVIVPKWAKHVQDTLQQHGVKYLEYDGTDDDRLEKLNSLAGARFSLRSSDADYMAAVEHGDMETAQRMVDEAAEEAMKYSKIRDEDGKLRKVYHGTEEDFTVFDRTKGRANMDIQGMFFSPWEEDAGGYGGKVRSFYLDIRNPASEDIGYKALNRYKGQNQAGVKARDDLEKMGYDGVNNEDMEFIAFYPEQIKLADPVTYDDNGNVIPLSERFNPEEEDIRYALKGEYTDYDKPINVTDADVLRTIGEKKSVNQFSPEDLRKASKWAYRFQRELGTKSPFFRAWFGEWREQSTKPLALPEIDTTKEPSSGNAVNADTKRKMSWDKQVMRESVLNANNEEKEETRIIASNIGEIVKTAIMLETRVSSARGNRKLPGTAFMHSFYSLVPIRNKIALVKMYAEEAVSTKTNEVFTRAYTIKQIEKVADFDKRVRPRNGVSRSQSTTEYSVADLFSFVKQYDKEFSAAPAANPELLNSDGTPMVLYHGTDAYEEFYTFKNGKKGWLGPGIYLTSDKGTAQRYADKSGDGGRVYELYAKVNSPLIVTESSPVAEILRAAYGSDKVYNNRARKQANDPSIITTADIKKLSDKGYDGIIWKYGKMPIEVSVFKPNQIKSVNNIGTYDSNQNDIRYSLRGESELSDREVLGEAMKEIAKTGGDQLYLDRYQQAYNELTGFQKDLEKQERIMAASASNTDEYRAASNRAAIYQEKIGRAEEKLEGMESDPRFAEMVRAERERAEAAVARDYESGSPVEQEREELIRGYEKKLRDRRRALDKYREDRNTSADRSRYIERITDTAKGLSELLYTNTDKKHVPEALKKPLGDFLNALNLYSKRYNAGGDETQKDLKLSQYLRRVQEAARRTENINEAGDYTGELYLPQGFVDQIADLAQTIENLEQTYKDADPVVHMNNDSLKKLDLTLRALKKAIGDVNKLYTNAAYQKVSEMGRASIHYLNGFTPMSKRNGKFKRYLNWDMATPVYAMDRFGKVGQSLFKAIRDGYGQRAQRLNEIEEYAAEHWTAKEAEDWKEDIKTFTFDRFDEEGNSAPVEVKLTVSQIMELYLATKRDQAMKHIEVGGIRARTITEGSKTLINQPEAAHLGLDEIKEITGSLTDRQREVCDAMSKYMRTTSAWGNEVSMQRFGYNAFGEPNYWPISTDEFSRDGVPEQGQTQGSNLYRLLNMTFTKAVNPHANNALLLNGAFETFAAHTTDMATYSTMALPALDMIKWYNFREKLDDGTLISTRGSMSRTYGDEAAKYIRNLISDFSGSTRTVERGTENQIYSKLMSHAKRAAVAGNLSVVLKQPGSILRAGYVLPRAMYLRPSALISRHDYNEMLEHSGIARWKSMGYFDTNLAKPMEAKIAGDETWSDKVVEFMTKGAEWADKNTMVSIWKAAKAQVAHDNKGMDRGSEEYFQKVTDLFEDIIYRTQVVDSSLTRSQSMRNPGFLGKTINAFMAEPTLSYNVMMDALTDVVEDHRQGRKGISKAAGKKIAVASTTYVMTQVVQALVGAMMGAWRDDDDYKTFMDKFWERVGSSITEELNPINSIPLVSFLLDSLNGDNSSVADSGLVQLRYAYNGFKKVLWKDGAWNENWQEDMANDWQKLTRYSLSAASYLSGLPGMNVGREVWNAWNNAMDLTGNQELKFHPYSSSDSNKARAGMLYDAVRRGDQARIDKLQKAMAANGTTEKVMGQFDDVVKEDLLAGNIGVDDAERLLIDYAGFDRTGTKSAYYKIQSWLWESEGGHEYNFGVTARAKEALASGDASEIDAAYRELTEKYGKTDKDARSTMGECITELYKNKIINRRTAEQLYRKYTDRTDKSIQQSLDKYE